MHAVPLPAHKNHPEELQRRFEARVESVDRLPDRVRSELHDPRPSHLARRIRTVGQLHP